MRILHTGDWHLKAKLGHNDRTDDINAALEQIERILQEREVDVMVVAGDIFREHCSREDVRDAIRDVRRIFEPFLKRGGTVLASTGNHDSPTYLDTLRNAMLLGGPLQRDSEDISPIGRFYLSTHAELIRLRGGDGTIVQFLLMPYPDGRYLNAEERPADAAARNATIQQRFCEVLAALTIKIDKRLPAVLVSHIYVAGVNVAGVRREPFRLNLENDILFDPSDVPTHFSYVALGHVHEPQPALSGASHVRYCGSIERLDYGERDDEKSVVLLDVGREGLIGAPEIIPLASTAIYDVSIDGELDESRLSAQYPNHAEALVRYVIDPLRAGNYSIADLHRLARRVFPRWYKCEVLPTLGNVEGGNIATAQEIDLSDMMGNVRSYLTSAMHGDPDLDSAVALAEWLIQEANSDSN